MVQIFGLVLAVLAALYVVEKCTEQPQLIRGKVPTVTLFK